MQLRGQFVWYASGSLESASPHEVKLVEATIDSGFIEHAPYHLVGDKAYNSDGLDIRLLFERGVEMIAAHRSGRKRPKTQDGKKAYTEKNKALSLYKEKGFCNLILCGSSIQLRFAGLIFHFFVYKRSYRFLFQI